jgi:hypothetical protein
LGTTSLGQQREIAREDVNLMPLIVDAARDYVTLGEMCDALREDMGRVARDAGLLGGHGYRLRFVDAAPSRPVLAAEERQLDEVVRRDRRRQ